MTNTQAHAAHFFPESNIQFFDTTYVKFVLVHRSRGKEELPVRVGVGNGYGTYILTQREKTAANFISCMLPPQEIMGLGFSKEIWISRKSHSIFWDMEKSEKVRKF